MEFIVFSVAYRACEAKKKGRGHEAAEFDAGHC
jgi:hypothetical protein